MSKLSVEALTKFTQLQDQIWQNVSNVTMVNGEASLGFTHQAPEATAPEALRALSGETLLVIQFAFASSPDNSQLIVLRDETFAQLASFAKGEEVTNPDETLIPDAREILEGIVQGICLACGIAKNEPMVASGLTLRYQGLILPDNFGRTEDLVKVEVAISGKDVQGEMTWFLDNATVAFITGEEHATGKSAESNASEIFGLPGTGLPHLSQSVEETGGLDLLMDIPLEISVELGRVKMLVKDVVELGTGSIVEIDKAAGEPVDVMVNGRLVARGEVVVIEDNFGVRITEIMTAQERISKLSEAA